MRRMLALGLSILLVLSGCASYAPSSAPVPQAGDMPAVRTEGPVTVGADPYVGRDRQRAILGGELTRAGVLPIQVFLHNVGDRPMLVRRSEITLELPDGGEVSPAGASATAAKLEGGGGVVGWTIAFGLIGFLAASSAEDKARTARLADYRSKQLQDVTLRKGESAHGFVFFIPPPGTPAFEEAILTVRIVDVEDAKRSIVHLPLRELGFDEARARDLEVEAEEAETFGGRYVYAPEEPQKTAPVVGSRRSVKPEMVERARQVTLEDELRRLSDLKVQGKITEEEYAALRKRLIEASRVSRAPASKRRDAEFVKESDVAKLVGRWEGSWKDSRGWDGDISVTISLEKSGGITDVVMAGEIEGTYQPQESPGSGRFHFRDEFSRRGKLNENGVLVFVGEIAQGIQGEIPSGTAEELYRLHRESGGMILKGDFTITSGADEGVTGTRLLRKAGGG